MKLPKFSLSFSLLLILFLFRWLSLLLLLLLLFLYYTCLLLLFAPLISTGMHFSYFPSCFLCVYFSVLTQLFDNTTRILICHFLLVLFFLQQGTIKGPPNSIKFILHALFMTTHTISGTVIYNVRGSTLTETAHPGQAP